MDYQKYLMEIGASSKLVKMGAVIETMYKLKPTLEEIVLDDNGQIILLLDSEIVKFSLNGNEAKIIRDEISKKADNLKISYIDEFGIEYIKGYSKKEDPDYINVNYGYTEKNCKFINTYDDSVSITIQGGDFGKQYNHNGSCLLDYIQEYNIINDNSIKDIQTINAAKTIIKYPISLPYYINNNFITNENKNDILIDGIKSIIIKYKRFIETNGNKIYPVFISDLLSKSEEQIKKENQLVEEEIEYYLNVMNNLKTNNQIIDRTEEYTDEIAKERRDVYLKEQDVAIEKKIIEIKMKEQEAKLEYEQLFSVLEQGTNNIIYQKQVKELLKKVSEVFKKCYKIDLSHLNFDEDNLNSYELIYQLQLSQKAYKDASHIMKKFLNKRDDKSLSNFYFNKVFNEQKAKENKPRKKR